MVNSIRVIVRKSVMFIDITDFSFIFESNYPCRYNLAGIYKGFRVV